MRWGSIQNIDMGDILLGTDKQDNKATYPSFRRFESPAPLNRLLGGGHARAPYCNGPARPGRERGAGRRYYRRLLMKELSTSLRALGQYKKMRSLPEKAHDIGIGDDTTLVDVEDGLLPPARDGDVSLGELKTH